MAFMILIFATLALMVLFSIASRRKRKSEILQTIRSSWGQPKREPLRFERIERYAEIMMTKGRFHQLSRQTLEDIDFYDLFSFLDRTSSSVGQQYFFHRLIHPRSDLDSLRKLDAAAKHLDENANLRETIQLELGRLGSSGAYFICSFLGETTVDTPKWLKFLPLSNLFVLLLILLGFQYPVLFVVLIAPLTLNVGLHYWSRERIYQFTRSFPQLSLLIEVAERVTGMHDLFKDEKVKQSISYLKPFQWKLAVLGSAGSTGGTKDELSQAVQYILELIKGFLLLEVYMSYSIIKELEKKRSDIATLFDYVGELDTAIAVANIRAGGFRTCTPEFSDDSKRLTASGLYHPLVKKCVKNDLAIQSKSILITGSNMSGKSTFLRTLIVNSILAQTIYTCFADAFRTPVLRQFSSIRLDDSIEKGTSYFFEEVNLMRTLIREAESGVQSIFILDEVFKGTNTVERVAAAKAILSYLNRGNNIVVVSTHDLELSSMLQNEYDLYHFEETLEDGALRFDHKLKKGSMKNGNAIKILALSEYPKDIIREATALVTLRSVNEG